jgi:hypothetical protein
LYVRVQYWDSISCLAGEVDNPTQLGDYNTLLLLLLLLPLLLLSVCSTGTASAA